MNLKFYRCAHCGKIIVQVKETKVPTICCGDSMKELEAGTTDASQEKHVPICKFENNLVSVNIGSVAHPMTEEHYIEWVALETERGLQIRHLMPNNNPEVQFAICNEENVKSVFAYCNLHGLWKDR